MESALITMDTWLYNEAEYKGVLSMPVLSEQNIRSINDVLKKEQRVELIPTKDGVKVIKVKREEAR